MFFERALVEGFIRTIQDEAIPTLASPVAKALGKEERADLRKARDLRIKAGIMRSLIDHEKEEDHPDNGVEQSRIPGVTQRAQGVVSMFVSGSSIENEDYLHQAIDRVHKEGKKFRLTPRHESDFDPLALRYILQRAGLEEFCNDIVWIAGVNMLKRPLIRPWMRGEHVIYIATPADSDTLEELVDYFPPAEYKTIEQTFSSINSIAKTKVREASDRGETVALYPEAGRSYDGLMRKAPGKVALYFPRDESTLVLPCRLIGPREINPPNRRLGFHKLLPPLRQHLTMIAGESYLSSEVWEWRKNDRMHTNPADWLMANIANADPRDIKPEDLARYGEMMLKFRPDRNRISNNVVAA